jgi:hypothetical protein
VLEQIAQESICPEALLMSSKNIHDILRQPAGETFEAEMRARMTPSPMTSSRGRTRKRRRKRSWPMPEGSFGGDERRALYRLVKMAGLSARSLCRRRFICHALPDIMPSRAGGSRSARGEAACAAIVNFGQRDHTTACARPVGNRWQPLPHRWRSIASYPCTSGVCQISARAAAAGGDIGLAQELNHALDKLACPAVHRYDVHQGERGASDGPKRIRAAAPSAATSPPCHAHPAVALRLRTLLCGLLLIRRRQRLP